MAIYLHIISIIHKWTIEHKLYEVKCIYLLKNGYFWLISKVKLHFSKVSRLLHFICFATCLSCVFLCHYIDTQLLGGSPIYLHQFHILTYPPTVVLADINQQKMKERYDEAVYKHTRCYFLSSIHSTIKCISKHSHHKYSQTLFRYVRRCHGGCGGWGLFEHLKKVTMLCFFLTSICNAKKWRGYRSISSRGGC